CRRSRRSAADRRRATFRSNPQRGEPHAKSGAILPARPILLLYAWRAKGSGFPRRRDWSPARAGSASPLPNPPPPREQRTQGSRREQHHPGAVARVQPAGWSPAPLRGATVRVEWRTTAPLPRPWGARVAESEAPEQERAPEMQTGSAA